MANLNELKTSYDEITALYDVADDLIASVEEAPDEQKEFQFTLTNPLVEQIEESTDLLTEEFINFAEGKKKRFRRNPKRSIEAAFRKIYAAMEQTVNQIVNHNNPVAKTVASRLSPLLDIIKRQVEKVISIFVGIIDLALESIMPHTDLENLRQHEERVAEFMHNSALENQKLKGS